MIQPRRSSRHACRARAAFHHVVLALVAALTLVPPVPKAVQAAAQWNDAGVPISTGSVSGGYTCTSCPDAYACAMVRDGQGGTIFAWSETRSANPSVYVQRLDAFGNPSWMTNGVPVCVVAGSSQELPGLASDGAGGAIVTWLDSRNGDPGHVYAQRVNGAGAIQWSTEGVLLCAKAAPEHYPATVSDGAGGAIVAWQDDRSGDATADIYAMRVIGTGSLAPSWPDTGLALCRATEMQQQPVAVPDGAGGAIVGWVDFRSATALTSDVYAQHVSASGSIWSGWGLDGNPVSTHHVYQFAPVIAADGSGGAFFAWQDTRFENYDDVMVQHMNGDGVRLWTVDGVAVTQSDGRGQYHPVLAPDGSGGVLVGWEDATSASEQDIYAQRLNASGATQWTAGGVAVCTAPSYQNDPQIVGDGTDGAVLVWVDPRDTTRYIYTQRVDGAGAPSWAANGVRVCTSDVGQETPTLLAEGSGVTLAGWSDLRPGLYAGRIRSDGTVPVAISLQDIEATPGQIRLTWYDALGEALAATVQRSGPQGLWIDLGLANRSASSLTYVDRDVVPGARYAYRLSIAGPGGIQTTAAAWVDVPRIPEFALEGAVSNPAQGAVQVAFTLPDGSPARLEVMDVSGRRWAARDVGQLGAGRHVVALDGSQLLSPGMYQLRLVRGGVVRVAPVVVIR